MKLFRGLMKLTRYSLWLLAFLLVAMAAIAALLPSYPSQAKYVLDPITYTINLSSYTTVPLTAIGPIAGITRVQDTLTAGAVSPSGATFSSQWQKSDTATGTFIDITGATSNSYTLTPGDYNQFIRLSVTGTGIYTGSLTSDPVGPVTAKTINLAAIEGVTRPVTGATAVATLPGTTQYTATISWSPAPSGGIFQAATQYTANITVTPKTGYTLTGITANFFTVADATTVSNGADSGLVTAVFPPTNTIPLTSVSISGTPQVGQTLNAVLTPSGATATYQWSRSTTSGGTYTDITGATSNSITLTAGDLGYYFKVQAIGTGSYAGTVTSNYLGPVISIPLTSVSISGTPQVGQTLNAVLTPSGATATYQWSRSSTSGGTYTDISGATASSITLTAGDIGYYFKVQAIGTGSYSGTVTSNYFGPVTSISLTSVSISGTPQVGQPLSAVLTPSGATATYQWSRSTTSGGTYTDISGATTSSFTLTAGDLGYFFKVQAIGTGSYTGTVYSTAVGPMTPKTISISVISGVSVPTAGGTASTTITPNAEYTGTIAWNPALTGGTTFAGGTVYTATITITPNAGYTLTGVPANFFTVAGTTSVSNAANSGVVTAVFPNTSIPVTAIGPITGTAQVGYTLTAGAVTPSGATVTYQWQRNGIPISGATSSTYTLIAADANNSITVVATGNGSYYGTVTSAAFGPIAPATVINTPIIPGISAPANGAIAPLSLSGTGYTATITWNPDPATNSGKFKNNTVYTATIRITTNPGYVLAPGFTFTVPGATTTTTTINSPTSATVIATYPST